MSRTDRWALIGADCNRRGVLRPVALPDSSCGEPPGRGRSCRAAQVLRPAAHPLVLRRDHGGAHRQRDRLLASARRARHLPAARRAALRRRVRAAAAWLLRAGWRVPGGVLVVATVAMVPTIGQAFERLIGVWPSVAAGRARDPGGVQGRAVRARARDDRRRADRLLARRLPVRLRDRDARRRVRRRSSSCPRSSTSRASTTARPASSLTGAALLLVGLVLDSVARGGEAFWWHAIGLLSLAIGLTWYAFFKDADWAWITILVVGAVLILASAPFHRATWTTFGVIGFFAATLNYDSDWFGSWKSPALMVAVSVGLILLGMVLSLYARTWPARLRRPAPRSRRRRPPSHRRSSRSSPSPSRRTPNRSLPSRRSSRPPRPCAGRGSPRRGTARRAAARRGTPRPPRSARPR